MEAATASTVGIDPAAQIFDPAQLPYNIVRSGTNTLTAKVAKNRPIPMYVTTGANGSMQRRVKLLNRFVPGLFHQHKAYHHGYIATRDAALYGTGQLLVQRDGHDVSVQKLYPWETYIDPVDARYGEPRSVYLVRYIDKDILKHRFGEKHEDAIETAPVLDEAFFPIQDVFAVATRCSVIEAWHLPSGPGAKDGRHTICLFNHTLLDEPYEHPDFPIVRLMKDQPLAGWWGMGLGDELSGFQDETNVMTERVQYAHRIVGGQIWLVPEGGGVLDTDFNDDIGVIVRHTPGLAPVATNPQPMHEQTYQYFKDLPPTAYGFAGISQMSAQAQKPNGVTAALALQTLDDIETDRFALFERAHEDFYMDLARHMLRCVREIADTYGDFRVFSVNRGDGQEIYWKRDIDLDEDSYVVQSWPVSLLPKTPAAKLQRVIELSANGVFDRAQVLKLLELPDTTAEESLILSPREAAEAQINHLLECEDPNSPDAFIPPGMFQDLDYSMTLAQQHYNLLQTRAIDAGTINNPNIITRLQMLDRYMQLCKQLSDEAKQEAASMLAAAQAAQQPNAQPMVPAATNVSQSIGTQTPPL